MFDLIQQLSSVLVTMLVTLEDSFNDAHDVPLIIIFVPGTARLWTLESGDAT